MRRRVAAGGIAAAIVLAVAALAAPAASRAETVALRGATVHPVSGPDLQGATLLLEGARIAAIGTDVPVPPDARRVDLTGLHVWPALINANSVLGLVEIGSVRGTVDVSEVGDINPNVRAEVALNPDSELLPVARAGGVLVAMTAPRGGLIAGTAALVRLDGWTWEDMTIRSPIGLVVNWPSMRLDRRESATPLDEQIEARDHKLQALRQAFADARAYQQARDSEGRPGVPRHERDPRWEAMVPVLRGELPVLVAARDLQQIRAALAWAREEGVRLVFLSGGDIARAADELAARDIPVVLGPTWSLPQRRWEPYDAPFTIAAQLHAAGVKFCFATAASAGGATNARNLPHEAAAAVAFGLPHAEAVKGMTQYAAEILGAADRLGTLEVGKEATLIVTDGDVLDTRMHVVRAWSQGRELDLGNRHQRLYDKYRSRPRPDAPPAEPAVTRRK